MQTLEQTIKQLAYRHAIGRVSYLNGGYDKGLDVNTATETLVLLYDVSRSELYPRVDEAFRAEVKTQMQAK